MTTPRPIPATPRSSWRWIAGEVPVAIVGDNYWFAVAMEHGEANMNARIHYVGHKDPGAFITISGATILKSAPHRDAAEKFLAYLVSAEGQAVIAKTAADYPLRPGVTSPSTSSRWTSSTPRPSPPPRSARPARVSTSSARSG